MDTPITGVPVYVVHPGTGVSFMSSARVPGFKYLAGNWFYPYPNGW